MSFQEEFVSIQHHQEQLGSLLDVRAGGAGDV